MSDVNTASPLDYTEIIKPVVQYGLYNPWPTERSFDFGGKCYRMPAKSVTPIYDRPDVGATALNVLSFAVGKTGREGVVGSIGVRALFGDARDQLVKQEAHQAQKEKESIDDLETCRSHELMVLRAQEAAAAPPRPSQRVMDAYKRRAAREDEEQMKFSCPACNTGFKDQHEVSVHVVALHKNRKDLLNEAESFLKLESLSIGVNLDLQDPLGDTVPVERKVVSAQEAAAFKQGVADRLTEGIRATVQAKK